MVLSLPRTPVRATARLARETLYLTVGAGVLAVQRVQVQRRELERQVGEWFGGRDAPTDGPRDPAT